MATTAEYYSDLLGDLGDTESLTVLVVRGKDRAEVATVLGVDLGDELDPDDWHDEASAWQLVDIPGGVLATEGTGYGDPSLAALRDLSSGGAAAVVRSNIQAHIRFGCARDGALLFDDDEYPFTEDPSVVPAELRPLLDLVWEDLDQEDDLDDDRPDQVAVGLAMAEVVTGIELTASQVAALGEEPGFRGPALIYRRDDG